ncbi:MAG: fumarylacetoacetate hydrolase family protein [Alphaproteobacteria bacterium]|jgi:2-keto-4-pentenoate hydratase/2-oxohepta-3-ene-1,7-dioic acid hydratase in catechol pathway|nr:fumarylacetoacetate hydrolase family protein [Pseudomonadota bacterium]MEC7372336.1 fumarylacetoacetate hydrolase family protein [Pseudomonadota bacterium]MEC7441036.1 fumarylacetoacetate hydrolase family protein [Pseudomonadota bacterium]MEC8110035.1 fumarylacetoacetate hydrolase family protein [Pseudomonadota bacterium]MEC8366273.1 fumarylacetoacetate hydrolase family protein [Pseudomonadota bacterium]|tara:strand:+ start:604 stop:1461 length:858 start_codon:yes stop_codon:yes gene_type:complete
MPSLISFLHNNAARFGRLDGETVTDLTASFDGRFASLSDAANAGALAELYAADGASVALADVTLTAPLPSPGKIICVGVNFPDRNAEYKDGQSAPANPSLFIRFPGSFVGHGDDLRRPPESEQLDYEGEIAIVIGAGGRRIEAANAWDHIAAVTLCNEGTIRDWVRHAKFNVTQGKNFEKSAAMGPGLLAFTGPDMLADIELTTRVNGEIRQQDRTSRMIFSFTDIIAYVSTFTPLKPGDVLVCGTPTGAGARFDPPKWLKPGDIVEISADGLGTLSNGVRDEEV